ncbi:alpha-D-mannose-specific plant lectins domain-containing protein [Dioscorea alata]|uniref:Alpha-D-mannose-specific plant lectins domain-containing protein n=1 Tax=Dioscorea alata TaxID=55571 RepID=A0ACB7UP75_DIOAL|nr:alpha-D-mannose-specific plant lectins domain-containing protein [Dioscorea alata]
MHPSLILLFISFSCSIAIRETVTPNNPLPDNETLISSDGSFSLGFFRHSSSSSNLYLGLWYSNITPKTIVWVANRKDPVINSNIAVLSISTNGNLLITNQNSTIIWSSGVTNVTNPVAQLLDTGNLVVRSDDDGQSYAWQGFDHPTDTLIAGMKLGVDFTKGLNKTLTAWTSSTDPSPSQYYAMMDIRGSPELVIGEGSEKMWRSGPWNGEGYSGIPETLTYSGFSFNFINNKQEITYSFTTNQSLISRLTVNASGIVQRWLLVDSSGLWNLMWYAPSDQCDFSPPCGPYATCNPNNSPKCDCIQGFKPKSPDKWVFRDATDGCVRKTPLDCKNGTDGFLTVPNTKLADTWNATVDTSLSLMECKAKCLNTCECNAYAPSDVRNGGSGCIIWTSELTDLRVFVSDSYGQDLYVRMALADLGKVLFVFILFILLLLF